MVRYVQAPPGTAGARPPDGSQTKDPGRAQGPDGAGR